MKGKKTKMQWFIHDVLGWHNCKGGGTKFDGLSLESVCTCGKRVLLDSQGNWFAV